MPINENLADKVRAYLSEHTRLEITEKAMFNMLNFMVDDKTCVCVGHDKLMIRFDPAIQHEIAEQKGYETMLMKGKEYKGYAYVNEDGFSDLKQLHYYLALCLAYNSHAKASKKKKV
jgi:hypothetical protein